MPVLLHCCYSSACASARCVVTTSASHDWFQANCASDFIVRHLFRCGTPRITWYPPFPLRVIASSSAQITLREAIRLFHFLPHDELLLHLPLNPSIFLSLVIFVHNKSQIKYESKKLKLNVITSIYLLP